jgi:hypothetical protein
MYADFTEKDGLRGGSKKSVDIFKELFREIHRVRVIRVLFLSS